jgi:hypothetical protein
MWQFQWMLSLIPDAVLNWIYWLIIIVGLTGLFAGWLGKFIPLYGKYVGILKPVGIVLLVLGVWLRGGHDVEMAWRDKIKNVEAKVAVAEAESKDANQKLEKERKKKQQVRKEYYATIKERIVEKEKLIDAKCELDPSVAQILNDAAKNANKKGTVTIEEVKK